MHEVSLVSAMVEQVEQAAIERGFGRVREIRIGIGAWSGVEPDCVEFCFPEVTRGSLLEGARLVIDPIPVQLACQGCGQFGNPTVDALAWSCDRCGGRDARVTSGKEFRILDLEVFDAEER